MFKSGKLEVGIETTARGVVRLHSTFPGVVSLTWLPLLELSFLVDLPGARLVLRSGVLLEPPLAVSPSGA